jgi:hypothetical protein
MVISPELADVLSAIICRVRDDHGAVPLAGLPKIMSTRELESGG